MSRGDNDNRPEGFEVPVHRALTEPILMGGAPRSWAILNGTIAAALGLGLQLWPVGVLVWLGGQALGMWCARSDPDFVAVLQRHLKHRAHLEG